MVTREQLDEMIAKAHEARACKTALDEIRWVLRSGVNDLLTHPQVGGWISWYYERIGFDPEFFPIIEPHIAKNCQLATRHAIRHKKAPWPEAHDAILHCGQCREEYSQAFPGAFDVPLQG